MGSDLVTMVANSVHRHDQSFSMGIYDILMLSHHCASALDFVANCM